MDALACGNQATRFIGFAYDQPVVAAMLVIVGDDDSCVEFPTGCSGGAEHLSFVGPQLGIYETGDLVVTKSELDGIATDPWQFEVMADNGCELPETPYVRNVPAGGGSVTFSDLAVTVDGTLLCLYTVSEEPVVDWTMDVDLSDVLTGISVTSGGPTNRLVVNRYQEPPPTTTVPPTTVPLTSPQATMPPTTSPATTVQPTNSLTTTTSVSTTTSTTAAADPETRPS